jgi:hypothetical protein
VTIRTTTKEELGKSKERKAVVYFNETKKGLVLNVTNARKIAVVTGTDVIDKWPGKKIALVPMDVEFQGEMITAIRVVNPAGQDQAPADDNGDDAFPGDSDTDEPAFADDARELSDG